MKEIPSKQQFLDALNHLFKFEQHIHQWEEWEDHDEMLQDVAIVVLDLLKSYAESDADGSSIISESLIRGRVAPYVIKWADRNPKTSEWEPNSLTPEEEE